MSTIFNLLEEFNRAASSTREKGELFERLIANYLLTDPIYSNLLSDVWLWDDWPYRWGSDDGIDLVARVRYTGEYWAIQCKFFNSNYSIEKGDIDSFFTASGKLFVADDYEQSFVHRLIVSTTNNWSKKAEEAINHQTIEVTRLGLQQLAESPIDWSQFSINNIKDLRLRRRKQLLPHQKDALQDTKFGFQANDRGKLIMACGTGKTLTSLRIAEEITDRKGKILFLAPSISLVAQTLREWANESIAPFHSFVVCSDNKIGKENEDIRKYDLAYPATTDSDRLAAKLKQVPSDRRSVIFSTYQSIQVVSDAQKKGVGEFDLIICDEAHRTTGISIDNEDISDFVKVHQQNIIQSKKRLYMTATPRIYNDASKNKADKNSATLYSMDDETIYGPEFHKLGFGKAVLKDLLAEYKVLIVAVNEELMAKLANDYNAFKIENKKAIDSGFATKIIGSWKGLSKLGLIEVSEEGTEAITDDTAPMKRAVAFSRSIKNSQSTTKIFSELVSMYSQSHQDNDNMVFCSLEHVDGTMNALKRQEAIEWLKEDPRAGECRILSNARCLSEGIDIPALDAVVFFDTRDSIVDIVQSVGRVMRKTKDGKKKYGYIILPIGIPSSKVKDYNSYIDRDSQFKGIWKVIKALRAHDDSLVDEAEFRKKIRVISASPGKGSASDSSGNSQISMDFPLLSIDAISEAVYAAIPKKLGDLEYWRDWAKNVAQIAESIILRIHELLKYDKAQNAFQIFLKGIRDNLNPSVTEEEAIEMLSQHVITRPVFEALFEGYSFTKNNPVSKSMQAIIEIIDNHAMSSEIENLGKFYESVRERVQLAKSDKSRQEIIRNLYDTFFKSAFPRMAKRLGIVYTPVEIVDFIINSVEFALRKHFSTGLTERNVHVLDPFTGTGTFVTRLLQSGYIRPADLLHKYQNELHANEIVLLAYYIAAINIESTYHALTGEYRPFEGIVLTDTFQIAEKRDWIDRQTLPENSERVNRQKTQDIRVIIGNPPYSVGQESERDNNKNLKYPTLNDRIRSTYALASKSGLMRNLYDSYILAIRWASDRIKDKGIIAFVTNGRFIDSNNADGLRKSLTDEFSHLYVFNLRGFIKGRLGEDAKREGQNVFDIQTGVAITVMVKDPDHEGKCELSYYDIGDNLSREEKLTKIENLNSINGVYWQHIIPNTKGDWINQRNPVFNTFISIGNKDDETSNNIFSLYSLGVVTNRDTWTYNFKQSCLESNMRGLIKNYNGEVRRYVNACIGMEKSQKPQIESVVDNTPSRISWTRALKSDAKKGKLFKYDPKSVAVSMYRPFTKQWLYFNRSFNEMVYQMPRIFPTEEHENIVISITGIGARRDFSALVTDVIPNLHMHDTGQCFPLYWYEKVQVENNTQIELFEKQPNNYNGYIRHEAITDWALNEFQSHYNNYSFTKEDIFWYIYGILHSPEYRKRFGTDLKKMLPRIPLAGDFWTFSKTGRKLGELHLNYECVEPYPLAEESKLLMDEESYKVTKMTFGKKNGKIDKSVIVYNQELTLYDIPLEAYDYVVNGKSAIEWIIERYAITKDNDSGIVNNPNEWSNDPLYIVNLLKRIVRVSLESVKFIKGLPQLNVSEE
ncbi:type ISP restriction/modification enzyme [Bacillus sp. FJAT-29814]|uniref:DEAD/DEAH box helicase n=1 Tax=Bacillus sp. FJAT-29814 TaxID=1729688 RepID=UPI00082F539B|nr:type ISP restriction/modification enzyme [Bacillus sp. FJAT-29814]